MKKVLVVLGLALTFSMNAQIDYSESIRLAKAFRDVNIEQLKVEKNPEIRVILKNEIKQYEIIIERFGGSVKPYSGQSDSVQGNAERWFREKYNIALANGEDVSIADLPIKEWREYLKEYNLNN